MELNEVPYRNESQLFAEHLGLVQYRSFQMYPMLDFSPRVIYRPYFFPDFFWHSCTLLESSKILLHFNPWRTRKITMIPAQNRTLFFGCEKSMPLQSQEWLIDQIRMIQFLFYYYQPSSDLEIRYHLILLCWIYQHHSSAQYQKSFEVYEGIFSQPWKINFAEFSISRWNYCDNEELYSLERVQTIGVTINWELNIRKTEISGRGAQPLDKFDCYGP